MKNNLLSFVIFCIHSAVYSHGQPCIPSFLKPCNQSTFSPQFSGSKTASSGPNSKQYFNPPNSAPVPPVAPPPTVSNSPLNNQKATCSSFTEAFSTSQQLNHFDIDYCPHNFWIDKKSGQAILRMGSDCGTRISSKYYFQSGYFEVSLRISSGSGVVTAFILRSDESKPSDEIDFEWVGQNVRQTQTNYFIDSIQDYTKVIYVDHGYDASQQPIKVAIRWTKSEIRWYVNDKEVRTLANTGIGRTFPGSNYLMRPQIAIWDGTQTSGWAGNVDRSQGPFYVYLQYVIMNGTC